MASIMLQVPLIAEEDNVEPWYSYVLKTERPEVVEGAVSSTPSRASSTYEPEQKVTVSLLCEISKEIMGLYAKAKKGAASAHSSILVWPQCMAQKMPVRQFHCFISLQLGTETVCSMLQQAACAAHRSMEFEHRQDLLDTAEIVWHRQYRALQLLARA